MKQTRVKRLSPSKSTIYLNRGENLLQTMRFAEQQANPDGIATNAIQAAIALTDAYTVHFGRGRSRGQSHLEVTALIELCAAPNKSEVGRLVARLLSMKTKVEYEDRPVALNEAKELARWVSSLERLIREDLDDSTASVVVRP